MDGVTILYTYTYTPGKIEFIFCLSGFIAFSAVAIALIMARNCKDGLMAGVIALGFLIGCIFTSGVKLNSRERHEVIIDGSIDFPEFKKKYKVIEVRGKIYTIEERIS